MKSVPRSNLPPNSYEQNGTGPACRAGSGHNRCRSASGTYFTFRLSIRDAADDSQFFCKIAHLFPPEPEV